MLNRMVQLVLCRLSIRDYSPSNPAATCAWSQFTVKSTHFAATLARNLEVITQRFQQFQRYSWKFGIQMLLLFTFFSFQHPFARIEYSLTHLPGLSGSGMRKWLSVAKSGSSQWKNPVAKSSH